jgi:hypothetical protein
MLAAGPLHPAGRRQGATLKDFFRTLQVQRWDDHRYYHHSRVNQALHLVSALSFLVAYVLVFSDPAAAALLGWLVAMTSRQIGHFFFEPKGYDVVNRATHEHKEQIKVGYNLRRKCVLLAIWALSPAVLLLEPTLFGTMAAATDPTAFARQVGEIWLVVGVGGLLFRTLQLCVVKDPRTGVVWMTKILTDPFHDVKMYYQAPFWLLRGQWLDPMGHVAGSGAGHVEPHA